MFWAQRLMLELSSSVLQRCCFLSQPQYGSRAPRHALTDRDPETQARWSPSLTCIPRTHLATPLWAPLSIQLLSTTVSSLDTLPCARHHCKWFKCMKEFIQQQIREVLLSSPWSLQWDFPPAKGAREVKG